MQRRRKFYSKNDFVPIRKEDISDSDIDNVADELDDADDGDGDGSPQSIEARHCSDLADLIVESNPSVGRNDAIA
jgi:hypothetical protein